MQVRKWIIPLLLVTVLIFVLSLRQLSDPDLGFHLKYGKWITENHHVPVTDQSTYTVPDHPYIDLHWLFQVVIYQVYSVAGYSGISLFVCILGLFLSLMLMLRNRTFSIPVSVTAIALLAGFLIIDPRIAPRPEMFTFLFLTGILLVLDLYAEHRKNYLYLIPVIMLLWCNMHALFVLGLIVTAVYFTGSWIQLNKPDITLLGWLAVSFLVCFVNPYGIHAFSLPIQLLTRFDPNNIFNQHIQEFLPFFRQPRFVFRDFIFLTFTVTAVFFTAFTWRKRKLHELILMAMFAVLAYSSIRNIPLFVLITLPVISRAAVELKNRITFLRRPLSLIVFILMILLPAMLIPRLLTNAYYITNNSYIKTGMGIDSYHQPVEAAAFIVNHHLDGRILNSIGFGGWLSWTLRQPVFIDGRLEVMQEPLYNEITDSWHRGLPSLIARYKPQLIVYSYQVYYPWTLQLKEMTDWRLIYVDGQAAIFTCDPRLNYLPTVTIQPLHSNKRFNSRFTVLSWGQGFFRQVDYDAIDIIHQSVFRLQLSTGRQAASCIRNAVVFFNAANQKFSQGDIRGALADYDTALTINPAYAKAFNNRGILRASSLHDYTGAIADFTRAIEIDSQYSDAYLGRGTASFLLNNLKSACTDWNRASSRGNAKAARLLELHCKGK
jgi:hypothetical protein